LTFGPRARGAAVGVAVGLAVVTVMFSMGARGGPRGAALAAMMHRLTDGPPRGLERVLVADVIDGDTLVTEDGRTVRLIGIDAPETAHPAMAGPQAFGAEAAERLEGLVLGRRVALEPDGRDADHYGRLLRHVWLGRRLIAEELIVEGLAYVFLAEEGTLHEERLRLAETGARRFGIGVWRGGAAADPAVFGSPP